MSTGPGWRCDRRFADPASLLIDDEDRYSRLRLISWWRQERLAAARVLVVGAGALGNEVIKNLALLGVGTTYLIDLDVDRSRRTCRGRCCSAPRTAAGPRPRSPRGGPRELNPEIPIVPMHGDVITDLGLGLFADVDLVIGCLDNREARLWVNRQCWKVGTPWIDAGIQEIQGVVKVFVPPDSACYECAMTERDYQLLNLRYSCPLLTRDEISGGQGADGADDRLDDGGLAGPGGAQAAARHAGRGGHGHGLQRRRQPVLLDPAAVPRGLPEPRDLSRAGRAAAGQRTARWPSFSTRPGHELDGPLSLVLDRELVVRVRLPALRLARARSCGRASKVKAGRGHLPELPRAGAARVRQRGRRRFAAGRAEPLCGVGIPPYDIVRVDGAAGSGFFLLAA